MGCAAAFSHLNSLGCSVAVVLHLVPSLSQSCGVFPCDSAAAQDQLVSPKCQFYRAEQTVVSQQLQQKECVVFSQVNLVE